MNRKHAYPALLVLVFLIQSCSSCNERQKIITKEEPVSEILDSAFIDRFLDNHQVYRPYGKKIKNYYKRNEYTLAWSFNGEFVPQAHKFINLIEHIGDFGIVSRDSITHNIRDSLLYLENTTNLRRSKVADLYKNLDLILTSEYYRIVPKLLQGTIDPNSHDSILWYVDLRKIKYTQMLDSILMAKDFRNSFLGNFEIHPQLLKLKEVLVTYREIEKRGGWSEFPGNPEIFSRQDTGISVRILARRLFLTGDISHFDTAISVYNENIEQGVKNFQKRHGLIVTGTVDSLTLSYLNIPVEDRLKQILVNMERWRWVPMPMPKDYILVNIPDFNLTIYQNGKPAKTMKIIVGKVGSATVVFKGNIEYIVVNPYWNIPESIAIDEILPKIKADTAYLRTHQIEVGKSWHFNVLNQDTITWNNVTEDNFDYTFRQKPGNQNPLGRIKFMFPNQFSIYLHDTPDYDLFDESDRGFSHGCIRIQKPMDLAGYLLDKDNVKITQLVDEATATDSTLNIALNNPVPVYILYFTVWVDENGLAQFRNDYYGHDRKLAQFLFSEEEQEVP